ncbi:hypothetical protein Tco_1176691 [Tanacetum coccineum]
MIALVKVRWDSKRGPELTWEHKDQMRSKCPQLLPIVLMPRVVKSRDDIFSRWGYCDNCGLSRSWKRFKSSIELWSDGLIPSLVDGVVKLLLDYFGKLSISDALDVSLDSCVDGSVDVNVRSVRGMVVGYVELFDFGGCTYNESLDNGIQMDSLAVGLFSALSLEIVPSGSVHPFVSLITSRLLSDASPNAPLSPQRYVADSDPEEGPRGPLTKRMDDEVDEEPPSSSTDSSIPSPLQPPPSSLHLPPHVPTPLPLPSSPLPPLPVSLFIPLPVSLFIPLPVDRREDIPKAELPPHKRLCLTAPTSRYEVGESSTAAPRPTRGHRADYGFIGTTDAEVRRQRAEEVGYGIRDVWVDPIQTVEEVAPTTLEVVNPRVTELAVVQEQDTQDNYYVIEDTQDRQTHLFQRVDGLVEDRQFHYETARLLDQEAHVSREAWAHSVGLSSVVHYKLQAYRTHTQMQDYRIASQESLMTTLIAQVSSLQGQLSAALGQIQALQARDQTHADDPEGAGSSA